MDGVVSEDSLMGEAGIREVGLGKAELPQRVAQGGPEILQAGPALNSVVE